MNELLRAVAHHGYWWLGLIVFAEASGLPAPGALALVAGGAAAATHLLGAPEVFIVALIAMVAGDFLLFTIGRHTGWALLGFICTLSFNPETCILRSAESFYKRGRVTLLFAKFIPGVNTMAPPLAGSMKMKPLQFVQLDIVGAALYITAYETLGYLFRDFLGRVTHTLQAASRALAELLIFALVVFVIYRLVQYRRYRLSGLVPRVAVEELIHRLSSGSREEVILADVRSHGYYDPDAARIAGSIRLEPNRLEQELNSLPRDKDIYLYCT
jgi:membrane protein DedA with SNARE-associated domain